ncbi:MAG: hypothetical protein MJ236_03090, partial [Clostridia bacterium]|nr:hypothetical protein [Clostridia bacterium]
MKNKFTKIGFIFSLISLILNTFVVFGLTGCILSIIGFVQEKKESGKASGYAIAGIIIGAISIAFGIFMYVFLGDVLVKWVE